MDAWVYGFTFLGRWQQGSAYREKDECVREFLRGFPNGTTLAKLRERGYQLVLIGITIGDRVEADTAALANGA